MITDEEFEAFIGTQVKTIDDILTKKEIDIKERPSLAADIFVKNCIIKVNEKPPENYIGEYWFKYIIKPITTWYKNKYGSIIFAKGEKISIGIVIFRSVFYELKIPLRVVVPKGELIDYIFPKEILPIEKEFDFIKQPPILSKENSGAMNFAENIRNVVNLTRSISNNIITSEFGNEVCQGLSGGIQPHIQKAVLDILSGEKVRRLNAFWEFHLAIEKSMKVLICQANEQFKATHDLAELWIQLDKISPNLISKEKLEELPGHKQAIQRRYGEGPRITNTNIYKTYIKVLTLLDTCTKNFKRRVFFDNTIFTLGKLPWQK